MRPYPSTIPWGSSRMSNPFGQLIWWSIHPLTSRATTSTDSGTRRLLIPQKTSRVALRTDSIRLGGVEGAGFRWRGVGETGMRKRMVRTDAWYADGSGHGRFWWPGSHGHGSDTGLFGHARRFGGHMDALLWSGATRRY